MLIIGMHCHRALCIILVLFVNSSVEISHIHTLCCNPPHYPLLSNTSQKNYFLSINYFFFFHCALFILADHFHWISSLREDAALSVGLILFECCSPIEFGHLLTAFLQILVFVALGVSLLYLES